MALHAPPLHYFYIGPVNTTRWNASQYIFPRTQIIIHNLLLCQWYPFASHTVTNFLSTYSPLSRFFPNFLFQYNVFDVWPHSEWTQLIEMRWCPWSRIIRIHLLVMGGDTVLFQIVVVHLPIVVVLVKWVDIQGIVFPTISKIMLGGTMAQLKDLTVYSGITSRRPSNSCSARQ